MENQNIKELAKNSELLQSKFESLQKTANKQKTLNEQQSAKLKSLKDQQKQWEEVNADLDGKLEEIRVQLQLGMKYINVSGGIDGQY